MFEITSEEFLDRFFTLWTCCVLWSYLSDMLVISKLQYLIMFTFKYACTQAPSKLSFNAWWRHKRHKRKSYRPQLFVMTFSFSVLWLLLHGPSHPEIESVSTFHVGPLMTYSQARRKILVGVAAFVEEKLTSPLRIWTGCAIDLLKELTLTFL